MKTELTKLNDSIRSVEDRVRTENDRMAEHKVELHALLLSAKVSIYYILLLCLKLLYCRQDTLYIYMYISFKIIIIIENHRNCHIRRNPKPIFLCWQGVLLR